MAEALGAPPSITPYVSPPNASTAVTCPTPSSRAGSRGETGTRVSSASASRPAGRLTKKVHRHPAEAVRAPQTTGPAATATAPPTVQTAIARARSA